MRKGFAGNPAQETKSFVYEGEYNVRSCRNGCGRVNIPHALWFLHDNASGVFCWMGLI